ncbi:MAG: polysaccharide pyruvyl transferase family protein [Candidatus Parcubacteria bacterium]|nr:polysaccharide pyruvyl transferase family protein [Candidatus Paceibacterota bacterium]
MSTKQIKDRSISPKILITNHFVNAQNLGDLALVEAIISQMREIFDNPEIILESDNPELSKQYFKSIPIVERLFAIRNIKLSKNIYSFDFVLKNLPQMFRLFFIIINYYLFKFLGLNLLNQQVLKEYQSADLILMIGGDYLSKYYAYKLRFMEIELAKTLKKPIILYAHSVGPFKNYDIAYSKKVLSMTDGVFARDEKSEKLLIEYGVDKKKIFRTADSVLLMKTSSSNSAQNLVTKLNIDKNTIGLVIRDNGFSQMEDTGYQKYLAGMKLYVDFILENGFKLVFIAPNNSDILATHKFVKEYNYNLPIFYTRDLQPEEAKYVLSKFKIVISSRMHPLIITSSTGVPVIGIGLEFKTLNYLTLVGLEKYCQKMDDFDIDNAKQAFNELNANYETICKNLQVKIGLVQEKSKLNMSLTKEIYSKYANSQTLHL